MKANESGDNRDLKYLAKQHDLFGLGLTLYETIVNQTHPFEVKIIGIVPTKRAVKLFNARLVRALNKSNLPEELQKMIFSLIYGMVIEGMDLEGTRNVITNINGYKRLTINEACKLYNQIINLLPSSL